MNGSIFGFITLKKGKSNCLEGVTHTHCMHFAILFRPSFFIDSYMFLQTSQILVMLILSSHKFCQHHTVLARGSEVPETKTFALPIIVMGTII